MARKGAATYGLDTSPIGMTSEEIEVANKEIIGRNTIEGAPWPERRTSVDFRLCSTIGSRGPFHRSFGPRKHDGCRATLHLGSNFKDDQYAI